jgi:hypothetical protein
MTGSPLTIMHTIDEVANALDVAVVVAEHLELAARATAQDAVSLARSLRRASDALQRLRGIRTGEVVR